MNIFRLSLDLDKTPDVPDWVTLRQGDKSGTVIIATIYDHGVQLVGTYNARVVIGNPDGEHYYRANATYNAGVATVTVDEQTAASVAGTTVGYFEILQGSTVIASTASFGVRILPSALDGAEPGEVYDTAIQDAIDGLNEAVAELPDTVEDILEEHPEWTTTVQDGSISVPKLASEVRSSLSGAILAAIGGTLVTAHDSAAVPPNAASIFGRSTQSGTPTPSSPVAIQSVTAAELGFAGVNLYNPLGETERTNNGVTWTPTAEGIKAVGTATSNSYLKGNATALTDPDMTYLAAGTYTLVNHDGATLAAWLFEEDMTYTQFRGYGTGASTTFTVPEGGRYFRASMLVASGATVNTTYRISLVVGSTATAFVPYQGSTLVIDLQGHELRSLPDGTRDEVTVDAYGHAVLVQRVGSVTFVGSNDEGWTAYTVQSKFRMGTSAIQSLVEKPSSNNVQVPMYCSQIEPKTASYVLQPNDGIAVPTSGVLTCFLESYQTASAWKAHLAESPMTLLYPLATPTTIDLGYVTLPTLPAPDLAAWAAQGAELALTYQRDATMAIAGIYAQLAPVDGPTATSNHAAGTYLMLGGTLCKVTTAIAAGETIAIGTNVVATTVMTEILALTA